MKGPYTRFFGDAGSTINNKKEWERTWYRTNNGQVTRTPLPYSYKYAQRLSPFWGTYRGFLPANVRDSVNMSYSHVSGLRTFVHNKAYAKWLDKARDSVQMGTNFAEGHQTLKLVNDVLRALRNPIAAAARAAKDPKRAAAGGYLAWHFGVEPLLRDLHDLLKILEEGLPKEKIVTAQAKGRSQVIDWGSQKSSRTVYHYTCTVRHSAIAKVIDGNLFTLAQLGVINPVSIAWEVIPFSFLVDWFYPVGRYLQQLDALAGMNLRNPYTTTLIELKLEHTALGYPAVLPSDPALKRTALFEGFSMHRVLTTPAPVVQRSLNPWSTSITRALTSISLLVQALPRR